ncbi:outer membrane protein [Neorhizobium sp. JUb45]|uniref:outer membrane protein n=1 Tax=unclassified Neorhizobium TaxID=2629175 RepID=UPI001045BDFE|nr:outer membrane protein [Neorhizobium sp. JUb45]TCR06544.1 outer membrane immunogenic protein [Neorhizobium sp. JUb45]
MFKTIALASALVLSASVSAMAADAVYEVPAAPVAVDAPAFTWAGAYAGVQGGAGWLDGTFGLAGVGSAKQDFDGGVVGGFVGYNWQFSNGFVAGIEGDLDYNFNEESAAGIDIGTDWAGSVRGRVGYAFDRALVYGAAGWTFTNGYVKGAGIDENEVFNGWTVGAGVDFAVTDNLFVRGEYRYNDFGDKDIVPGLNADLDQSVVKVGLGVKF